MASSQKSFRNGLFGRKARQARAAMKRLAQSSKRVAKELYKLTRPGEIRQARNVSDEITGVQLLPDFPFDEYVRGTALYQQNILEQWENKCTKARTKFQKMREEKETEEEEGRQDLAKRAKMQKEVKILQQGIKQIDEDLDARMEFVVAHEGVARAGLENVDEVEAQMEYARNIRPENIRFAGGMIKEIQIEVDICKAEDIRPLGARAARKVISDLFDGGIMLNENYSGPEKVYSSKKKGDTVEQSHAVIAQMLQIEWGQNAVAPAVAHPGVAKAPGSSSEDSSSSDDDSSSDESNTANRASALGAKRKREESDADPDGNDNKKFKPERFSL